MSAAVTQRAAPPVFRPSSGPGIPECFIANDRPGQPVLVAIHGISRNAAEIALRFAAHPAFAGVTIIAPLFVREAFGQYQQLEVREEGQTRSDTGLLALMDDLAAQGVIGSADRFSLFGFSGGAQMAHRFAMLHPAQVARLCIVSAGWYCLPRPDLAWPYGLGDGTGGTLVGPAFLDIPTTVIVGNRDTRVDATVRQEPAITDHQGRNRLRRAHAFVQAMTQRAAAECRPGRTLLLTLPGMSHDFTQCVVEGDLIGIAAKALLCAGVKSSVRVGEKK